jgi:putative DNA primase/helicase
MTEMDLLDLGETIQAALYRRGGKLHGDEIRFRCANPTHEDRHPSARFNVSKLVFNCPACGVKGGAVDLARLLGIEIGAPRRETPIGLASLAQHTGLPADFLRRLGVHDLPDGRGVGIPYRDEAGVTRLVKQRTALTGRRRFWWPKGTPAMVYGLDRLAEARQAGQLVLVEGESDCWTCWLHGVPALGIPGADAAQTLQGWHLDGIKRLYIWRESDHGGATFVQRISARLRELGRLS